MYKVKQTSATLLVVVVAFRRVDGRKSASGDPSPIPVPTHQSTAGSSGLSRMAGEREGPPKRAFSRCAGAMPYQFPDAIATSSWLIGVGVNSNP